MNVFEKIIDQQKGKEGTDVYMVGQQLKDICRDPHCAQLVEKDLEDKAMSLQAAAGKIKAWADEQRRKKKGASCICVPPDVAEGILREFYGLPGAADSPASQPEATTDLDMGLDLADFF